MKIKLLIIVIVLVTASCSSLMPVFVADTQIVNGGINKNSAVAFVNSKIENVGPNEAVAFYRGEAFKDFGLVPTNQTVARIGKIVMMKEEEGEKKVAMLNIGKYMTTMFNEELLYDKIDISKDVYKEKTYPVNYNIMFQNIGNVKISEIVFVDALPKEFTLDDVQYYNAIFGGGARFKDNDFDEMLWEVKQVNGVNYVIIKMKMEKDPMGTLGYMDIISVRLVGKFEIN